MYKNIENLIISMSYFLRYQNHVPVRDSVEKLPSKKDPPPAKYRLTSGSNSKNYKCVFIFHFLNLI